MFLNYLRGWCFLIQLMQSSSTFLGFLGSTAYLRFVLLKLMVNLKE